MLCGCGAKKPQVTFRTVKTEGINAYIAADYGTSATTGKTELSESVSVSETDAEARHTKHYETTIPETLTGITSPPETTAAVTEAEITEADVKTELTSEKPPVTTLPAGTYNVIDDSGIMISEIDGHYWALMPCWGTYSLCESWAESVNRYKELLPDVNVYNMVVPTSSEFYVPDGFDNFTSDQWNKIQHIGQRLVNVKNIDVYSALASHTAEPIFSRTDHHWFPLGGYYAAQVFAEAAGTPFADLSGYKRVSKGGFVGSMYMYTESPLIYGDPEQFDLYIPPNNDSLKTVYYNGSFENPRNGQLITSPDGGAYYCSFLGSDDVIAKIETNADNDRVLVIFKESYGNAVVPFLTSSFKTIYVCDIRYFYLNPIDFCKNAGATDLLFSVCTYTPAGANGNYIKKILEN